MALLDDTLNAALKGVKDTGAKLGIATDSVTNVLPDLEQTLHALGYVLPAWLDTPVTEDWRIGYASLAGAQTPPQFVAQKGGTPPIALAQAPLLVKTLAVAKLGELLGALTKQLEQLTKEVEAGAVTLKTFLGGVR